MTLDEARRLRILPAGESALVIELGDAIDPDLNQQVYDLAAAIERASVPGVQELIPTYRSLLVRFDPLRTGFADMARSLEPMASSASEARPHREDRRFVFEVPVAYGGADGPDLPEVARHAGLTEEEVIAHHTFPTYRVYMLGFAPGFPYLGGLDPRIACPRLKTPRTRVPAGSVGIAEQQTGIYPLATPGGWQIIGRTPAPLFRPDHEPPVAIMPGSFMRFVRVSAEESEAVRALVSEGQYEIPVRRRGF